MEEEERFDYTPKKETLKEKLREESIWIMLVLFFGFILVWTIITFSKEMRYVLFGKSVNAVYTNDGRAVFRDKDDKIYSIGLSDFLIPKGTKDNITLYYFEGEEAKAIVISPWQWWLLCFGMCIFFVAWGCRMLYKNFRKERLIKSNYVYEKKNLNGEEIGRCLVDNMSYYGNDLYERHKVIENNDIIKVPKNAAPEVMALLAEQDKIWRVGTIYLALFREEGALTDGIRSIIFTNASVYLKNPIFFREDVMKTDDVTTLRSTYEADTYIKCDMLPFRGEKNRFYLVIAKPGICEYALMLPEWYYMKEELENF